MPTTSKAHTALANFKDFLFADVALREDLLSDEVLAKGQTVLTEMSQFGIRTSLVSLLVDRHLIEREQAKEIVSLYERINIPCTSCRKPLALKSLSNEGRVRCPGCGTLNGFEFRDGASAVPGTLEGRLEDHVVSVCISKGPGDSVGAPAQSIRPEPKAASRKSPPPERERTAQHQARPKAETPPRKQRPVPDSFLQSPVPEFDTAKLEEAYLVERLIHVGPSGRLYLARLKARPKGPDLALKVLSSQLDLDPLASKTFREEVAFWNSLYPDLFVPPYAFKGSQGCPYSCRAYLQEPFEEVSLFCSESLEETTHLLRAIAASLAQVHEKGRFHGNLKPSNIFYDWRDGVPRIVFVDSVLSQLLPSDNALSRWSAHNRSPEYSTPEGIENKQLNAASDVYSLGWIFFTLLSGESPFEGESPPEILSQHRFGPCPELPESLGPWRGLVKAMTAVSPKERPRDAGQVLTYIDTILQKRKPKIKRVTPRPPLVTGEEKEAEAPKTRRKQNSVVWRCLLGPLVLIAALSWIGYALWEWRDTQRVFYGGDRNAQLYHQLADEAFKKARTDARTNPEQAQQIWKEYLRIFGNTSFEGAVHAELRNLPETKR